LGYEGSALMNGISALKEETWERFPIPFYWVLCKDPVESCHLWNRKGVLARHKTLFIIDLGLLCLQNCAK
jgi:hypothetical protein